jgi:RNA polymerase sigma-70 factor (ECF subfamily)
MSVPDPHFPFEVARGGRFATTRWSVIAAAQDIASAQSQEALALLCTAYWYPLYAFIRRQGFSADEGQDLTQGFFAELLERQTLAVADRAKGKFRSFLLTTCKHYLSQQRERARAQNRGGGRALLSLDIARGEARYLAEPAHTLTPDKLFERGWALTMLDQVLGRLREEFAEQGRVELFDRLRVCLLGEKDRVPLGRIAQDLGMTEGAIKVAAHRLRRRFRELVCAEIARTVDDAENIEGEIRDLFAALAP